MGIFEFTADQVVVGKDIALIKPFKKIMEKKNAHTLLAYIYHVCDYNSPYAVLDEDKRIEQLKTDLLDGKEPTKDVQEAIEYYKRLSETDAMRILGSARKSIIKLEDYFENIELKECDDPGKAAKDLMANLKGVGDLINKLKEWEELIKKEKAADTTRKGIKQTKYNT